MRAVTGQWISSLLLGLSSLSLMGCYETKQKSQVDKARDIASHEEALVAFDLVEDLKTHGGVIPPRPPGVPDAAQWNLEGVIPPMCYTKTEGLHNPCYVCHQNWIPGRENRMFDKGLQQEYSFSNFGLTNHWLNLFEDRRDRVNQISDAEIEAYVSEDNYSELDDRLRAANFGGWIPDLDNLQLGAEAFDSEGFAKDGSWWRAFSYKPMPSSFWPTNGNTDDVMIRLAPKFYKTADGSNSRDVYKANLAILEAAMKGVTEIGSTPFDESVFGVDLDQDGRLGVANRVVRPGRYVGQASGEVVNEFLYPRFTEFLHTVRYVGLDEEGHVYNPPHMKEVRYMKKRFFIDKATLGTLYDEEFQEKFEGNLPDYQSVGDDGVNNKMGWWINGFIESYDGRLRWTTWEEKFFCMGCHNTIGSTIDKTFAFPRKVDGGAGWKYIELRGMRDAPTVGEDDGEYLTYLRRVGGGGEFRSNPEMQERFFNADGTLDEQAVLAQADIHDIIAPSKERALLLNKAYKAIVEQQDFIFGRDATVTSPINVFDVVPDDAPTLPKNRRFDWNIINDWSKVEQEACAEGQTRCVGECVDTDTAEGHCGSCGNQCPATATCNEGNCVCPSGQTACGGSCVDLEDDPQHCGECDNACLPGSDCVAGACACPAGTAQCGPSCVDLRSSPEHCGECDNACGAGRSCDAGSCECASGLVECGRRCVNQSSDPCHCGSCGFACDSGEACSSGACVPSEGAAASCEELLSLNESLSSENRSLRSDNTRLSTELLMCVEP